MKLFEWLRSQAKEPSAAAMIMRGLITLHRQDLANAELLINDLRHAITKLAELDADQAAARDARLSDVDVIERIHGDRRRQLEALERLVDILEAPGYDARERLAELDPQLM